MTEFLEVDEYGHFSAGLLKGLQERIVRAEGDDLKRVREIYDTDVKQRMVDSGLYSYKELESYTVHDDGTATGDGNHFSGAPTYQQFLAYVAASSK